jgi:hypothetical protein
MGEGETRIVIVFDGALSPSPYLPLSPSCSPLKRSDICDRLSLL